MSSNITLTSLPPTIAWTMVNGVNTASDIDPQWMRAFADLQKRVGGVLAMTNAELQVSAAGAAQLALTASFESFQPAVPQQSPPDVTQSAMGASAGDVTWQL